MRILIVNTYDTGGAANACLRLHEGLLASDLDSSVVLRKKVKDVLNTEEFQFRKEKRSFFRKFQLKILRTLRIWKILRPSPASTNLFINNRSSNLETFSYPFSSFDITESPLYQKADIINLHWVAGFIDYESFFEKNTKPVVWTLHDMWPFTGGEHYEEKSLGIDGSGKPIQRIKTQEEIAESATNLMLIKKSLYKVKNLTIVAPSKWLVEEAKKSEVLDGKKVYHIPYGLDSDLFSMRDKEFSRNVFKIPKDKKVMLFVADSISNHRKGFEFLKRAFERLALDEIVLCAVGKKSTGNKPIEGVMELGPIYDERLMSMVYSAADVFVIPSLMDNLPNTVLESIMCGTPVVGFPIGGIPDMINDGENGLLTKEVSVDSLVETLEKFLETSDNFDGNEIRQEAVKKYSLNVQSSNYIKLFGRILDKS